MSLRTDLPALLRGCKAEPLEDAPRHVLADWLEEDDEPERAEFVRLQLAPIHLYDDWMPGRAAEEVREHRLLKANVRNWLNGYFAFSGWAQFSDNTEEDAEEVPSMARFERGTIKLASSIHQLAD